MLVRFGHLELLLPSYSQQNVYRQSELFYLIAQTAIQPIATRYKDNNSWSEHSKYLLRLCCNIDSVYNGRPVVVALAVLGVVEGSECCSERRVRMRMTAEIWSSRAYNALGQPRTGSDRLALICGGRHSLPSTEAGGRYRPLPCYVCFQYANVAEYTVYTATAARCCFKQSL